MSDKKLAVGFDRYIERDWLDQIAQWVIEGKDRKALHGLVDDYLKPFINGATSLRKTKNVLFGIWVNTKPESEQFKRQAIEMFPSASRDERLAIHWGLALASYPFFASLTRLIGRLLRLQDDIISKELVRRSVEQHGDTETVRRATARLLQSLAQWGVLKAESKSLFHPNSKIGQHNTELATWLVIAPLLSSEKPRVMVDELTAEPALFPFDAFPGIFQPTQSSLINIIHQGIGETIVALRKA
ncbi:hypothetical protein [Marinobacter sp. S6332]|uniref:hypothetical protein n=1 Tax=Marinobacter sp. S6332 TaxID=2926403 RepID=UPI001FF3FCDB|nr:hypothetical protein [Marinobacter sp. S6332]MCK0165799.1 hypothetical protein [Marinobacter sp. S6332]